MPLLRTVHALCSMIALCSDFFLCHDAHCHHSKMALHHSSPGCCVPTAGDSWVCLPSSGLSPAKLLQVSSGSVHFQICVAGYCLEDFNLLPHLPFMMLLGFCMSPALDPSTGSYEAGKVHAFFKNQFIFSSNQQQKQLSQNAGDNHAISKLTRFSYFTGNVGLMNIKGRNQMENEKEIHSNWEAFISINMPGEHSWKIERNLVHFLSRAESLLLKIILVTSVYGKCTRMFENILYYLPQGEFNYFSSSFFFYTFVAVWGLSKVWFWQLWGQKCSNYLGSRYSIRGCYTLSLRLPVWYDLLLSNILNDVRRSISFSLQKPLCLIRAVFVFLIWELSRDHKIM